MRKLFGINNQNTDRKVEVYFDADVEDYIVRFFEHGIRLVDAEYWTDCKQDAYNTANCFVNTPSSLRQSAALTDLFATK